MENSEAAVTGKEDSETAVTCMEDSEAAVTGRKNQAVAAAVIRIWKSKDNCRKVVSAYLDFGTEKLGRKVTGSWSQDQETICQEEYFSGFS